MTGGINDEQIGRMSKTIFRFCLSRTGSYHDAEDLTQDILLVACKTTNHFESEKAFYAFVWKTAGNILKSWYRRQSGQHTEKLEEDMLDHRYEELEEQAQDHEQLCRILSSLARLSSDYRRVTVAYYINGRSVREIAERFSLSESMVKYLLFQSRKRIREGINMDMESGRLSYDPVDLTLIFWGGKCVYYDIFNENRLHQNIVMACYYDRLTEEQLSLQLGVPTAYLEDALKKLLEYDLLIKKGLAYQSNIVIITGKELEAIDQYNRTGLEKTATAIRAFAEEYMDELRALGFYGSDMPMNSLRWMLISLILRQAYIDLLPKNDPYFMSISAQGSEDGTIFLWDVPLNGEALHPVVSPVRANMLISLPDSQPVTDSEKLICSELLELGLARKESESILPAFPYLNAEQSSALNSRILPVAQEICDSAMNRIDGISRIMKEYAPEHLTDYAGKLPVLIQMKEAETMMRIFCESGWLLPLKNCLSTTVMMRSK